MSTILDFAYKVQEEFERTTSRSERKEFGHFATPNRIAKYMASMFQNIPEGRIRLLEPGAGTGILSAALCDKISQLQEKRVIELIAFENHSALIPYLSKVLNKAKEVLEVCGHEMTFQILEKDFILSQAIGQKSVLTPESKLESTFDLIIMNPPYFKLRKESPQAQAMKHILHGQPNIYAFFMALGAELLNDNGELVAITPRSYCNGLYFREFRKWFFDHITPFHIHLFESRSEMFQEDDVLQENIIAGVKKSNHRCNVNISVSNGKEIENSSNINVSFSDVFDDSNNEYMIRIPSNQYDQKIVNIVSNWSSCFQDLGFLISTGPIVTFRAKEYLLYESTGAEEAVPLLSMHNVRPFNVNWPIQKKGKPSFFELCKSSMKLLLPVKNYLLLKRFTSKEEKRRIVAGILREKDFSSKWIGLENHLNYIYKAKDNFIESEVTGLAALLNSGLIDRYFRTINGNTQVNATEIRVLPLPPISQIRKLGETLLDSSIKNGAELEELILDNLNINGSVKNYLLENVA